MNALELLTEQHDDVETLFAMIEKAKTPARKAELFRELADNLAAHATVEEMLFYPTVMAKQTEEILTESTEEHLQIKRILADLLELSVDDEHFDAKLAVMKEEVEHHAREEEEGLLFPKVRKMFDADDLAGLGNEMLMMFEAVLAQDPRDHVRAETYEAAQL